VPFEVMESLTRERLHNSLERIQNNYRHALEGSPEKNYSLAEEERAREREALVMRRVEAERQRVQVEAERVKRERIGRVREVRDGQLEQIKRQEEVDRM
jgi:hypothetical protein